MPGPRKGWPAALQGRESGAQRIAAPALRPNGGVLVLEAEARCDAVPGGILGTLSDGEQPIHYLDLGGVQAPSLAAFGGSAALWAGVSKLYASSSGLASLAGVEALTGVRYLYLDGNCLEEPELLRLLALRPGQLEALDLTGNPGNTDALLQQLIEGGLLSRAEFLNGRRLRDLG